MKKTKIPKEVEDKMLTDLNDFMSHFGINEIQFGKSHKIKKKEGKKAEAVIKKKNK